MRISRFTRAIYNAVVTLTFMRISPFTRAIYNAVVTLTFSLREYRPIGTQYETANITKIESIFIFILGIIDFFISIALSIILLPYYFIQQTLGWILRLLSVKKLTLTPTKYSHLITKTAVLALATFIFLQYAHTKLADNPITNYFKNLFNKLGIQLDNNALTASLISMTIFAVLFMLRPCNSRALKRIKTIPLDNLQFTFFIVLSIAAGPIAYTLNTSLPVAIVIGLAPLAIALLMLVGNTISTYKQSEQECFIRITHITFSEQLKTLAPTFNIKASNKASNTETDNDFYNDSDSGSENDY